MTQPPAISPARQNEPPTRDQSRPPPTSGWTNRPTWRPTEMHAPRRTSRPHRRCPHHRLTKRLTKAANPTLACRAAAPQPTDTSALAFQSRSSSSVGRSQSRNSATAADDLARLPAHQTSPPPPTKEGEDRGGAAASRQDEGGSAQQTTPHRTPRKPPRLPNPRGTAAGTAQRRSRLHTSKCSHLQRGRSSEQNKIPRALGTAVSPAPAEARDAEATRPTPPHRRPAPGAITAAPTLTAGTEKHGAAPSPHERIARPQRRNPSETPFENA